MRKQGGEFMANWYGSSRSNYFCVKDQEAFLQWAESRGLGVFRSENNPGHFAIHSRDNDSGSWPSYDMEADTEIDLVAELARHLPKGEVAVLMEIGAEKLRYLTGVAIAVNHRGRAVVVSLDDVYRKAARTFRVQEREITQAAY
jgi:hypothetical protein